MTTPDENGWMPIETIPHVEGQELRVKLSNGREVVAEYSEGPPGKESEWGGWLVCMTESFLRDSMAADAEAEWVSWRPEPLMRIA